jgi:hypothetical protein
MPKVSKAVRELLRNHPNTSAIIFGCLIAAALLMIIEIICSQQRPPHATYEGGYPKDFLIVDTNLGYKAKPNARVRALKRAGDGEIIFDVEYSTDSWGRRLTPVKNLDQRSRFLVFFGCSGTFGYGLNNNASLPYYIGQMAPLYKPYNEALVGYGPQHMLAVLEDNSFYKSIEESRGIVLCIGAWIHRAVPSNILYGRRHVGFPYYYINESGQLIRDGSFKTGKPITSLLYDLLRPISLAKSIGLHKYLTRQTQADIRVTASIVIKSSHLVRRNFSDANFYLVIPPGLKGLSYKQLVLLVRKAGVNVLDYSEHSQLILNKYKIPRDGHPTAAYNQLMAELIVRDIGLNTNKVGNLSR